MSPISVRSEGSFAELKKREETQEEYEERLLKKRAAYLNNVLKSELQDDSQPIAFDGMTKRNNRKQVAQKFYSLLVLQKAMAIELHQTNCYGDVTISRGPKFETAVL